MGPSLTALALLLSQGPAREKPADRLHVEWISPEGCPERSSLREALVASVPPQRTFSAVVRVDEPRTVDARWRAVIITRVDDLQRLRVIEGANCSQVTEAAVLVVTIAALELRQDDARTAPVELPPRSQSDEVPPEAAAEEDKQPGPPDEPFSIPLRLQPMLGANVGLFPVPGVSVGLAVATRLGPFWLQLGASSWLENESAGPRRKVHLALQSFSLRAAWLGRLGGTRLELGPCLAGELGPLAATGVGVASPGTETTWWAAALAGVQSSYEVTSALRLSASLELGLNLVRPRFTLRTSPAEDVEVHRVGWVLGRLSVGLEVDLL
ncbi:MAG: hypothetical protein ACOZQL_02895 [Myxococcota bacterium]